MVTFAAAWFGLIVLVGFVHTLLDERNRAQRLHRQSDFAHPADERDAIHAVNHRPHVKRPISVN